MEFSDIQPVSTNGQLQPTSISTAADLSFFFNSRANAGDQVEMFLTIAEGKSEAAITFFSTVVRKLTSQPIKALALQGFGKVSQPYKQALALCASQESQELLKLLCNEIRNRSSDLTAWAAAEALRDIGFPPNYIQHPQHGGLSETPRRIQNEILDRKIQALDKIQRLNSRGKFTAEYERFLEFWIYGPTDYFLKEKLTSQRYLDIVEDIAYFTQIRGVQLGLNSSNNRVQDISLEKAKIIFKQYADSIQGEFKETLGNSLKRFLKEENNSESDLQILVEAFICETPRYNIDDLRLSQLTSHEIEQEISQLELLCPKLSSAFSSAINVSYEKTISDFLLRQENAYIELIGSWIKRLGKQIEVISKTSVTQKSNIDLVITILGSMQKYDENLYRQVFNKVGSSVQELQTVIATTQETQKEVNNKLCEIKKVLSSYLSSELTSSKYEIDNLDSQAVEHEKECKKSLKWGLIFLAIGLFAEVLAAIILILLAIGGIFLGAALQG